jgi:hypothetical protein
LPLEERATLRHEYLDGVIFAWQGYGPAAIAGAAEGTTSSSRTCGRLAFRAARRPLPVLRSRHAAAREAKDPYFYPDLMITCSFADLAGEGAQASALSEPVIIIEG